MSDDSRTITRLLLANSQALFREAVKAAFFSEPDVEVVAEAKDGREAVAEAERTRPDVAVLDADLPNCDGIKATALIKQLVPRCRVMILADDEDPDILIAAVEAGAIAYLTKGSPLEELREAARAVNQGQTLIPANMLGPLLAQLLDRGRSHRLALRTISGLTHRERQVLELLTKGADNQAIAQALVISPQTARTHIQNVLAKLKVHSRLEAAAFVLQNGILEELVSMSRPHLVATGPNLVRTPAQQDDRRKSASVGSSAALLHRP